MSEDSSIPAPARGLLAAMLLALASAFAWALVSVPARAGFAGDVGLGREIGMRMDQAGVANPVTAVLLNFRAYDTLLEIGVLTIALLTIWSLREAPKDVAFAPAGRALRRIIGVLVPFMVLIAGYLLWAGASLPGGAFPAAAVAAAALVLVLLADIDAFQTRPWHLRVGIVIGLLTFVGVGLMSVFWGLNFLEYPPGWAKPLIVAIECAGAVSIALILAGVFAGSPSRLTRSNNDREPS